MTIGLVGRKCGMTRIFTESGESVPVTVVQVLANRVTQVKSQDVDGYRAVQVTYGSRRPQLLSKGLAGHYAKSGVAPGKSLVESKSFKLYLNSFRNHPAFHEDTTLMIGKRLAALLRPRYLRIAGYWYPRGGIPIDVFWQTGRMPKNIWLPDLEVEPYRGRG